MKPLFTTVAILTFSFFLFPFSLKADLPIGITYMAKNHNVITTNTLTWPGANQMTNPANVFYGDGSHLTGISGGGSGSQTPLIQDVNGDFYSITNLGLLGAGIVKSTTNDAAFLEGTQTNQINNLASNEIDTVTGVIQPNGSGGLTFSFSTSGTNSVKAIATALLQTLSQYVNAVTNTQASVTFPSPTLGSISFTNGGTFVATNAEGGGGEPVMDWPYILEADTFEGSGSGLTGIGLEGATITGGNDPMFSAGINGGAQAMTNFVTMVASNTVSGLTNLNAATASMATNAMMATNTLASINPLQFGAKGDAVFSTTTGYVSGDDDSAAFIAMANYVNTNHYPVTIDLLSKGYLLNTNVFFTNTWAGVHLQNGLIVSTNPSLPFVIGMGGDLSSISAVRMYGPEIGNQRTGVETNCGLYVVPFDSHYSDNYIGYFDMEQCIIGNFETNMIASHLFSSVIRDSQIVSAGAVCLRIQSDETHILSDQLGSFNNHYGISYGPANAPHLGTNGVAIQFGPDSGGTGGGISLSVIGCNINTVHKALNAFGGGNLQLLDDNTENSYGQTNDAVYCFSNSLGGTIIGVNVNAIFGGSDPGSNMLKFSFNHCRMNDFTFQDCIIPSILETNSQRGIWPQIIGCDGSAYLFNATSTGYQQQPYFGSTSDNTFEGLTVSGGIIITNDLGWSSILNIGNPYSANPTVAAYADQLLLYGNQMYFRDDAGNTVGSFTSNAGKNALWEMATNSAMPPTASGMTSFSVVNGTNWWVNDAGNGRWVTNHIP